MVKDFSFGVFQMKGPIFAHLRGLNHVEPKNTPLTGKQKHRVLHNCFWLEDEV